VKAAPSARRKRRSRPSLRTRIRTFWLLGIFVIAAGVWGGWTLATLPAFHLHDLAVTGATRVSRGEIVARAAIDPRANVWLLDRGAIERRIAAIPFVRTATVHREPLANVWIDVEERRPDGCVRDAAGHESLVDDDLRVLTHTCASDAQVTYAVRGIIDAPPGTFLTDPELRALQADAHALASTGNRYRSFSHDAYGELDAVMESGIDVRFGDDGDLGRKERLIGPILAEIGPRIGNVRSLDVRAPSTPVVEFWK
jgi:hypothetical protein